MSVSRSSHVAFGASTATCDRSRRASRIPGQSGPGWLPWRALTCVVVMPERLPELWRRRHDDHGAVSLEQVLWFVAAGLSVAVVAGILWSQIRTHASTPINLPSAP